MKIVLLILLVITLFSSTILLASEGEAVSAVGTLSSITTDVTDISDSPTEFSLEQNHPNPFNPTTTISYALPKSSYVTLKVYDINGQEVKTLVNKAQNVGYYTATFDASSLSSGLYFYTLQSDDFISTKKMILLK